MKARKSKGKNEKKKEKGAQDSRLDLFQSTGRERKERK